MSYEKSLFRAGNPTPAPSPPPPKKPPESQNLHWVRPLHPSSSQ